MSNRNSIEPIRKLTKEEQDFIIQTANKKKIDLTDLLGSIIAYTRVWFERRGNFTIANLLNIKTGVLKQGITKKSSYPQTDAENAVIARNTALWRGVVAEPAPLKVDVSDWEEEVKSLDTKHRLFNQALEILNKFSTKTQYDAETELLNRLAPVFGYPTLDEYKAGREFSSNLQIKDINLDAVLQAIGTVPFAESGLQGRIPSPPEGVQAFVLKL